MLRLKHLNIASGLITVGILVVSGTAFACYGYAKTSTHTPNTQQSSGRIGQKVGAVKSKHDDIDDTQHNGSTKNTETPKNDDTGEDDYNHVPPTTPPSTTPADYDDNNNPKHDPPVKPLPTPTPLPDPVPEPIPMPLPEPIDPPTYPPCGGCGPIVYQQVSGTKNKLIACPMVATNYICAL